MSFKEGSERRDVECCKMDPERCQALQPQYRKTFKYMCIFTHMSSKSDSLVHRDIGRVVSKGDSMGEGQRQEVRRGQRGK